MALAVGYSTVAGGGCFSDAQDDSVNDAVPHASANGPYTTYLNDLRPLCLILPPETERHAPLCMFAEQSYTHVLKSLMQRESLFPPYLFVA
jgi:hypothetical protein